MRGVGGDGDPTPRTIASLIPRRIGVDETQHPANGRALNPGAAKRDWVVPRELLPWRRPPLPIGRKGPSGRAVDLPSQLGDLCPAIVSPMQKTCKPLFGLLRTAFILANPPKLVVEKGAPWEGWGVGGRRFRLLGGNGGRRSFLNRLPEGGTR